MHVWFVYMKVCEPPPYLDQVDKLRKECMLHSFLIMDHVPGSIEQSIKHARYSLSQFCVLCLILRSY